MPGIIYHPAFEFGARSNRTHRPSLTPPRHRTPVEARLAAAAAARAASLEALRARAAKSVARAVSVAAKERERRAQLARERYHSLSERLATAERRREQRIAQRGSVTAIREARARELRNRQINDEERKRFNAQMARAAARDRRHSLLGDRAARAARLSPTRLSPTSLPLEEPQSDDLRVTSSASSLASLQIPQPALRPSSPRQELACAVHSVSNYFILRNARKSLIAAGANASRLAALSFEQLTALLEEQAVKAAAVQLVRIVEARVTQRKARVLLSSLLIALHPSSVDWQPQLLPAARYLALCIYFGNIDALNKAWRHWAFIFDEWKRRDQRELLETLVKDAVATEALRMASTTEWEDELEAKQKHTREMINRLAGAAGVRRLDAALRAARGLRDEHIIHEMMLDLPGLLSRAANIREVPEHQWEQLSKELSATPVQQRTLRIRLKHIEDAFNVMLRSTVSLPELSDTEPDSHFAAGFVSKACNGLRLCQAEAADAALQDWERGALQRVRNGEIVPVLRELTEIVDRTRASVSAFRIRAAAPVVQQYGAVWERARFMGHIQSGEYSDSVPRTRAFLQEALSTSGGAVPNGKEVVFLMQKVAVRLVMHQKAWARDELPEIFALDERRITRLQNLVQRCALLAALHATVVALGVQTPNLDGVRKALDQDTPTMHEVVESAANQCEHNVQLGRAMCERAIRDNGAIVVTLKRVEDELVRSLQRGGEDQVASIALNVVREDVLQIVNETRRMVSHTIAVHSVRLAAICRHLISQ